MQEMANTAWSFAAMQLPDEPLLAALAAAAINRISELAARDLSNTVWAFATFPWSHTPLLASIAAASIRPCQYTALGLAMTAWSESSLGFVDPPWRDALAASAIRIRHFEP